MNGLRRLAGTVEVVRRLPGQRAIPFLDPEHTRALRDKRVRDTVVFAAATVPHYRDLLQRDGIDPREIRTAEDLERLPILSKEELRADPDRFRSSSLDPENAIPYQTTGTTGVPITVVHDRASVLANIAHGERERAVESLLCGKKVRYTIVTLSNTAGTGRATRAANRRHAFLPIRPSRHAGDAEEQLDRLVPQIDTLRPDVLRSYGCLLELFYRWIDARGIEMHRPKVIVYGSDLMTPAGRAFIEERFGIPVLSRYNAVESFKIGFFCEERRGFHLHEDLCHVSIVDENGKRLPHGARGEVVISNLVNRGTVLLNYRLADLATITTEPCTCGRTSPLLTELEGRLSEIIHLKDGSIVMGVAVWDALREWSEVIKYQLVQEQPERFRITLVTPDFATYELVVGKVASALARLLHGAAVETAYCELEASRDFAKYRRVVPLPHAEAGV